MNGESVIYLMSGPAHLPYLATSLVSLRRHWSGTVKVYAWPESYDTAAAIAKHPEVRAEMVPVYPLYRGKNDQFIHKIEIMQTAGGMINLYLDADTLVVGDIRELFAMASYRGMCVTQFSNWNTTGGTIRTRVGRLREFPEIDQDLIDEVLGNEYPSVNGGVFACTPNNTVLTLWHEWTMRAKDIFIADECVLHLMVPKFTPMERIAVAPGRFNSSPKYTSREEAGKVRIWHGHGDCWTRPEKSREGWAMWSAALKECQLKNVGGINGWIGKVGNKFLDKLIEQGVYQA